MVATKLSELAGKGLGWYGNPPDSNEKNTTGTNAPPSSSLPEHAPTSPSAPKSLQQAAQSAYSGIASVYSSLSMPSLTSSGRYQRKSSNQDHSVGASSTAASPAQTASDEDGLSSASGTTISGLSKSSNNSRKRRKSILDLSPNLLRLMDNPYIGVRGGGRLHRAKPPNESMNSVRKLLYVVDEDKKKHPNSNNHNSSTSFYGDEGFGGHSQRRMSSHSVHFDPEEQQQQQHQASRAKPVHQSSGHPSVATIPLPPMTPSRPPLPSPHTATTSDGSTATPRHRNSGVGPVQQSQEEPPPLFLPQPLATIDSESRQSPQAAAEEFHHAQSRSTISNNNNEKSSPSSSHSPEETASQLTEGTLRALRDLALDEALELHASLKYWSDRWERPVFSWFVAGPLVWFDWISNTPHCQPHPAPAKLGHGYDHAVMVGQRVSQIQAVLARRLSTIGELQQHLLRAGWQRGVADWGFLGDGGNWAAVDGTNGRMMDGEDSSQSSEEDFDGDELEEEDDDAEEPHEGSGQFFSNAQDTNTTMIHNSINNSSMIKPLDLHQSSQQNKSHRYRLLRREFSEASVGSIGLHIDVPPPPLPGASPASKRINSGRLSQQDESRKRGSLYYTNLHVRKQNGGYIQKDDQALAEWSIDALALIRAQLIRAANGRLTLPYSENWPFEHSTGGSSASVLAAAAAAEESSLLDRGSYQSGMPVWAGMKLITSGSSNHKTRSPMESRGSCFSITENVDDHDHRGRNNNASSGLRDTEFPRIGADCFENQSLGEEETLAAESPSKGQSQPKRRSPSQRSISSVKERTVVSISNLPLMMSEVSSLLDIMEDIMDIQRARRLEKLKPPPWWRQNWFLVAMAPPTLAYFLYNNLIGKGQTWNLVKYASTKMIDFARDHVVLPCMALYDEFTKGQEFISDHSARDTAAETLKKMIRSWLDETYPKMEEAEKMRLSNTMDISLIEESKEQSMKSVYNINDVIRMSFIEAQFIKKEMMNALVALDEMQASTNFNMNLAAITPFVLLIWSIKKVSSFIFYTAFKWGKSRKETYRSFLDALTEIERLLIMRSNPPAPLVTHRYDSSQTFAHHREGIHPSHATPASGDCVLESDDLGMLMLHIHELRTILWQERRRFSPNALRSVSEDLAELSGERGAVSVRQQLLIVERMNRAYSFVKQGAID